MCVCVSLCDGTQSTTAITRTTSEQLQRTQRSRGLQRGWCTKGGGDGCTWCTWQMCVFVHIKLKCNCMEIDKSIEADISSAKDDP